MCVDCFSTSAIVPAAPKQVHFVPFTPQQWTCFPSNQLQQWIPPPPVVVPKKEAPKPEPPKEKPKAPSPSSPPDSKPGYRFVFPRKLTYVHLVRDTKLWETGTPAGMKFKQYRVPTSLSMGEFLEALTGGKPEGMAITEVTELGDGGWSKGLNVAAGSDKAAGTLASFGWNEKAHDTRPPIWLVLHKA